MPTSFLAVSVRVHGAPKRPANFFLFDASRGKVTGGRGSLAQRGVREVPWVRLDDAFAEHPKVIGLSDGAFRAHVSALCYCNRNLTDGRVPAVLGNGHAEELVAAGVWEQNGNGFVIHDYGDYQMAKSEVEARLLEISHLRSEAGKRGAQARWNGKNSKRIANASQTDSPKPVPKPKIRTTPSEAKASSGARTPDEHASFKALFTAVEAEGMKAPSGANASARSGAYRRHDSLGQTMLTLPALTKWWGQLEVDTETGVDRLRRSMTERGIA